MSLEIDKRIVVDLICKNYKVIDLVQNDSARAITFTIVANGTVVDLTGLMIRAYSSTDYYKDLIIIDATNGICKLNIDSDMVNKEGEVDLQIRIADGNSIVTSFAIKLQVEKSLIDYGAIQSSNQLTALDNALNKVNTWNNYFASTNGTLETKYTGRLNNIENWELASNNLFNGTVDFSSNYWVCTNIENYEYDSSFKQATISDLDGLSLYTNVNNQGVNLGNPSIKYTLSAYFKASVDNQLISITVSSARIKWKPQAIPKGVWTKLVWTWTGDGNSLEKFRFGLAVEDNVKVCKIMLNRGDKTFDHHESMKEYLSLKSKINNMESTIKSSVLNTFYPIGSIYMSTSSINPANFMGGTWVSWGKGKTVIGVDSADDDFKVAESTGGSKTQELRALIGAVNSNTTSLGYQAAIAVLGQNYTANYGVTGSSPGTIEKVNHSTKVVAADSSEPSTLQPYITCYIWKRTA